MFRGYSFYSPQILFCRYRFFFLLPLFFWVNWADCVCTLRWSGSLFRSWSAAWQEAGSQSSRMLFDVTVRGVLREGRGRYFCGARTLESHNITFEFCLWKHRGAWFTQAEPWLLLVPNKSSLKSNSQLNPRPVKRQGDLCFFFFVCLWILHNRQRNGREKDCNDVYWTVSCNTEARQDCKNDISLYPSGITFGI